MNEESRMVPPSDDEIDNDEPDDLEDTENGATLCSAPWA